MDDSRDEVKKIINGAKKDDEVKKNEIIENVKQEAHRVMKNAEAEAREEKISALSAIQAFVFTILSSIYIGKAIHPSH